MRQFSRIAGSILVLVALFAASAHAQETETLLGEGFESGGFGGPMVQLMPVDRDVAVFVGGRGGWIINHAFSIGGGGWGLTNELPAAVPDTAPAGTRLFLSYGGLILEYTFRPHKVLHYTASLLSGWGSAGYSDDVIPLESPSESFFVLEPAVHGELNVTEFFRITLGLSWRYTDGLDLVGLSDADMQEVAGVVTFKFGSF